MTHMGYYLCMVMERELLPGKWLSKLVGYALPHSRLGGGEHDYTRKGSKRMGLVLIILVLSDAAIRFARAYRIIKKTTSKKK